MEKYRQEFGVYNYQEPLSNIAGIIMAALKTNSSHIATYEMFPEQTFSKTPSTDDMRSGSANQEEWVKNNDVYNPHNEQKEEEHREDSKGLSVDKDCFSMQNTISAADNVERKGMCDGLTETFRSSDLSLNDVRFMGKIGHQETLPLDSGITLPGKPAANLHGWTTPLSSCDTSIVVEKKKNFNDIEQRCDSFLQMLGNRRQEYGRTYRRRCGEEPQICDIWSVEEEEKHMFLEEIKQAKAVVLTMVFQDGSTQLNPSKDLIGIVDGFVILVKRQEDHSYFDSVNNDRVIFKAEYFYMTIGNKAFSKKNEAQDTFLRNLLLSILQRNKPAICFNAKDFLRAVLYGKHVSWKNVLKSVVFDPSIAGWLLNPEDCSPSFQHLVTMYCGKLKTETESKTSHSQVDVLIFVDTLRICSKFDIDRDIKLFINTVYTNCPVRQFWNSSYANSNDSLCYAIFHQAICNSLDALYALMLNLQPKLLLEGLWTLFCTIELPLISILAVMENQKIQVNQEELRRTSELIGTHLEELERDAHEAAGEKFKLTSSKNLREILFDTLHLHLQCKNKLPRTSQRQFPSTSEAVLHQLQDLHPLPKIILEFRQMQKIKSTFVDGLLSFVTKGRVSSTWNQTGTVSGRLSAKQPNIQGFPKLPVQILKPQYMQGKKMENITVNPRSMFISAEGYTFLAADFSQVELRLMAHFSLDPELLKLFQGTNLTDVFTKLASQWKDIDIEKVTQVDREQAKRVAYSAIYGAGKDRLAECLGVTPTEANAFIERFLQKYRLSDFTQRVIRLCQQNGFVVSLMGRKRLLPKINAQNYSLRAQAERQAVNFVIQGSAADLCKMAMIEISASIASSSDLSARLIAQIHDELLFEVEDSQIDEFAALVKGIMESLQHVKGIELKVPLKVTLSSGKSWGCMTELQGL